MPEVETAKTKLLIVTLPQKFKDERGIKNKWLKKVLYSASGGRAV